jgi:hypothetical protein
MTHTSMQSGYPLTIKIDDFLLPEILNIRKLFIHNWRVCFIEINVGSLRKALCNQPHFVSYQLIIFIPFPNE